MGEERCRGRKREKKGMGNKGRGEKREKDMRLARKAKRMRNVEGILIDGWIWASRPF